MPSLFPHFSVNFSFKSVGTSLGSLFLIVYINLCRFLRHFYALSNFMAMHMQASEHPTPQQYICIMVEKSL